MTNYFFRVHEIDSLDIGDRIQFRAVTRWCDSKVWRKVNGFWGDDDKPTVRFGGCGNFIVHHHEIVTVEKATAQLNGEA